MLRVVFDTVVFVRALLNQRNACGRLVFDSMDCYQLYLSTPVVIEILQVLAREELVGKLERRRGTSLQAIAGLLDDAPRRERLAAAARREVAERFTLQRVVDDLTAVLEPLVAG